MLDWDGLAAMLDSSCLPLLREVRFAGCDRDWYMPYLKSGYADLKHLIREKLEHLPAVFFDSIGPGSLALYGRDW
jgi:hypothetical protein